MAFPISIYLDKAEKNLFLGTLCNIYQIFRVNKLKLFPLILLLTISVRILGLIFSKVKVRTILPIMMTVFGREIP